MSGPRETQHLCKQCTRVVLGFFVICPGAILDAPREVDGEPVKRVCIAVNIGSVTRFDGHKPDYVRMLLVSGVLPRDILYTSTATLINFSTRR